MPTAALRRASLVVKSRPLAIQAHGACSSMAERVTVDYVLIHGAHGVTAAQMILVHLV